MQADPPAFEPHQTLDLMVAVSGLAVNLAIDQYRQRLSAIRGLDHLAIEINHCRDERCQPRN